MKSSKQKLWVEKDRKDAFAHELKVLGHQAIRACKNLSNIQRWPQSSQTDSRVLISERSSRLWYEVPKEEWQLEAGKVANVRLASGLLKGLEVPAGETFSFWAHVGRPSAVRGFVPGREVRAGCVIPTIAGGLCLLSNALYAAALDAGFEIVERHSHTKLIFDDASSKPDATVFWNYVDLRFRSDKAWRLEVDLDATNLHVRIFGEDSNPAIKKSSSQEELSHKPKLIIKSCWSCEVQDCRHYSVHEAKKARRAFLLDNSWPEFSDWVQENLRPDDLVLLPVNGQKRGFERYLLVHLHRQGALGGRDYDILATRPSLKQTQERLDLAVGCLPNRSSLSDFRVDHELEEAERVALARARKIVTPNNWLVEAEDSRFEAIPWSVGSKGHRIGKFEKTSPIIHFPGSTIARLGVCSLREAIMGLDIELQISGRNLEEEHFWDGIELGENKGIEYADLVVYPAWLPHNPRTLLRAVELGIPLVVSDVFGVGALRGVTEVPCGEPKALRAAILKSLDVFGAHALAR
jgi:hypothetical protein